MFVDASVLSAMMTDEEEARNFAARMQAATARMTSPLAVTQAAISVAGRLDLTIVDAGNAVRTFLELMNIQLLAIPPRAAFLAIEAHERYGEGRHPAALSLDDCMTYACARYYRQPLLFRSDAFAQTDIEVV
ncbi:type II toxin-antitoxin system VapC family toxin [Rhizobium sp. LEGMi198b]|uniref:type II toxin-antitoxin system VapC family toxin n=1 Tax=unclassified Rhizobium TaxID=2613769 RepID=UPI000CDF50EA|nr:MULTISPECIES: type II toxin-antitoxin system VapC family toxin [Rhizobium]AVA23431.1 PilT domain-containing protein [Rhizobium sp. NXC24]MDK4739576.1 type II toxin-antitoxin system VapC family toxin [Rhizobium sp. CNPSo 3464]UWU20778.1 type II toxin-antitoxin system VapC family toxin [Rhizobium tropici]WFU01587.1 type II toxin-antitoxin system VapC family toxin [Rhizobium sp. CB3171]